MSSTNITTSTSSNALLPNPLSATVTDTAVENQQHPKEWLGTLPVSNCIICQHDEPIATLPKESIDLFDYCHGGKRSTWYGKSYIIRFDPVAYPLPEDGNSSSCFHVGSSGHTLITDLLKICHRDGRSIYCSNGSTSYTKCKESRRVTCHYWKANRNTIGRGCGSTFVINVDHMSLYMKIGTGNGYHRNHTPHDVATVTVPKRIRPPPPPPPIISDTTNIVNRSRDDDDDDDASVEWNISTKHDHTSDDTTSHWWDEIESSRMNSSTTSSTHRKRVDVPQDLFGPLYNEITTLSKGDTLRERMYTKKLLEDIVQHIKERRATMAARKKKRNRHSG